MSIYLWQPTYLYQFVYLFISRNLIFQIILDEATCECIEPALARGDENVDFLIFVVWFEIRNTHCNINEISCLPNHCNKQCINLYVELVGLNMYCLSS